MTDGMPDHALRLHHFVREVQVYAGAVACPSTPRERLRRFETLLDLAPAVSQVDRLISERLLAEALRRLYVACRVPDPRLTGDRLTLTDLRGEFTALCQLRRRASVRHMARFFELIGERYRNSDLREEDIARELGISARHLSRLVNGETGRRFDWHVRALRVRHAAELLLSSELSMKEIAAAAGFSGTSELDHQFHGVHGVSPSSYRETNAVVRTVS
jgi:AraC-like DNA-binding protein